MPECGGVRIAPRQHALIFQSEAESIPSKMRWNLILSFLKEKWGRLRKEKSLALLDGASTAFQVSTAAGPPVPEATFSPHQYGHKCPKSCRFTQVRNNVSHKACSCPKIHVHRNKYHRLSEPDTRAPSSASAPRAAKFGLDRRACLILSLPRSSKVYVMSLVSQASHLIA